MLTSPTHEIEISIDGAKKLLALRQAYDRLEKNKDFKLLIAEGYLVNEALRLTGLLSEVSEDKNAPAQLGGLSKDKIVSQLQGIAHFSAFLRGVDQKTENIADTLRSYEQERELQIREAEQV